MSKFVCATIATAAAGSCMRARAAHADTVAYLVNVTIRPARRVAASRHRRGRTPGRDRAIARRYDIVTEAERTPTKGHEHGRW